MDDFSSRIRRELLDSHPEWQQFCAEERWKDSEPYLVVTVPAPEEANTTLPLRISTWDGEVTVDFDYYHTHFDRWQPHEGDTKHQSALLYVRELLAERIAVASWWQGELCKVCAQLEPGAPLQPPLMVPFSKIRVRSWYGAHNSDA